MENIEVACFMLQERGLNRGSHMTSSEAGDAAFQTGSHDGIIAYQVVLQIASFYLNCYS